MIYCDKDYKEYTRYQLYVAIQSNSKKKIDMHDVCKLPWDNRFLNKSEFKYDRKEEKISEEKASTFEDMLNNGTISFTNSDLMKKI